jgi:hypothetical protein
MRLSAAATVVAATSLFVSGCATTPPPSVSEFAKSATAILADSERDYDRSPLVHLTCTVVAQGGNYILDMIMTPAGEGRVMATQAGRASAFLQMAVSGGEEYLYEAPSVAAFSESHSLPAADYSKWLSLGPLAPGQSLSLFNRLLQLATNSSRVFDETAPVTKGSTQTVRGKTAIDVHWQNDSGVEITMAVDDAGHVLQWRGATPNGTPTFSVDIVTDLTASAITPPPNPAPYLPEG